MGSSSPPPFTPPSIPHLSQVAYLVGDPIAHSSSPSLHEHISANVGIPYRQVLAETADLNGFLAYLRHHPAHPKLLGSGVTMPHKVTVIPQLDGLTPEAAAVGAVNTIFLQHDGDDQKTVRLIGHNTDTIGVRDAFLNNLPASLPTLIVGGGGTCRAAIYALHTFLGCDLIYIINRDEAEVAAVLAEFRAPFSPPGLVVSAVPNFTPLTDAERVMCYHPSPDTEISRLALENGWQVIGGIEAMVAQGCAQSQLWTGAQIRTSLIYAGWADNTANATCTGGDVCIQDFYEVMSPASITKKIEFTEAQFERSGACCFDAKHHGAAGAKFPLYVNFLTASNFWNVGTWPEKIAGQVNPAILKYLLRQHMVKPDGGVKEGDWSTGIAITDWVSVHDNWDLFRAIVGMNRRHDISNVTYGHFGLPSYHAATQQWTFPRNIAQTWSREGGGISLRRIHQRVHSLDPAIAQIPSLFSAEAEAEAEAPFKSRHVLKDTPELLPASALIKALGREASLSGVGPEESAPPAITSSQLVFGRAPYADARNYRVSSSQLPFLAVVSSRESDKISFWPVLSMTNISTEEDIDTPDKLPVLGSLNTCDQAIDDDDDYDLFIVEDDDVSEAGPDQYHIDSWARRQPNTGKDWSWIYQAVDNEDQVLLNNALEHAETQLHSSADIQGGTPLLSELTPAFQVDDIEEAEKSLVVWRQNALDDSHVIRSVFPEAESFSRVYEQTIERFVRPLSDNVLN
ncbi:hypothetical protein DV735_g4880, partial [Chaetothyriales sp. CBS 134920]